VGCAAGANVARTRLERWRRVADCWAGNGSRPMQRNEEGAKGVCGLLPFGPKKRMTGLNRGNKKKKKFWAGFSNEIWPMKSVYLL